MTTAEVDVLAGAEAVLRKICAEFPIAGGDGSESDRIAAVEESGADEAQVLAIARQVQSRLFDAGLAWPDGPAEYGGRELDEDDANRLESLIDSFDLPTRHNLFVGLHIVAPAILEYGTPEQRQRYLPALFRGDQVGCQLFSEPGAGSDLAGVSTKAVREGDDWVITGQKVWTSHGHVADLGEALVRTDPTAPKHSGMTMFMVDMHAPGVTVRPLRQITGGAAFNEVFLDEVRVPDSARIGAPGEGWRVALTSLSSERGSMGGAGGPLSPTVLNRLAGLIEQQDGGGDPFLRVRVAQTVGAVLAMRAAMDRADDEWLDGIAEVSGSVQKMLMTRALDEVSTLAADLLGHRAFVDTGVFNTHAWSEFILGVPGLHLAGGTDEIQRGLIANRGLRLPR
ncbi:acyl-CoA dehydrogenase [Rhodococcus sp. WS3]|uniref:acyl-CoA dehydrogenase family protein n=1 Tax=Rhodococcus sp. WS3 TaxID=2486271 RepID=UPI001142BC7D|nr:acyl-CoA dehydrogenase family protein [Rhodococcus sp. WS3]ROZ45651.1 acyl-CoA dehydrogenase [Rhodococcus sp. WS3]